MHDCAKAMPPCPPFLTLSEQLDKLLPRSRRKRLGRAGFNDVDVSLVEENRSAGERRRYVTISYIKLDHYKFFLFSFELAFNCLSLCSVSSLH